MTAAADPKAWLTMGTLALVGCYSGLDGDLGERDDGGEASDSGAPEAPPAEEVPTSGLRRLTIDEYDATLYALLGDDAHAGALRFPPDRAIDEYPTPNPFSNDYTLQVVSTPLVEGAEVLAQEAAQRLVDDPDRLAGILPCVPSGPGDADCFRKFVGDFGARAFRRPLAADEVDAFLPLLEFASAGSPYVEAGFDAAIGLVVSAMLQDVRFLYRVEVGTPVEDDPTLFRLDDYEIASRISYLVWGSMPDAELFELAAQGKLVSPTERAAAVAVMFEDPRALDTIERFHAQWLAFERIQPGDPLSTALREETRQAVQRAVFEDGSSYLDLFVLSETYLASEDLAQHYGMQWPGEPGWVPYGEGLRGGLFSHGTVMSAKAVPGDTSPSSRGNFIRSNVMCQPIPPPPPDVSDALPESTPDVRCKVDRLRKAHQAAPSCAACHVLIDSIGFGLENYDRFGAFRGHEVDQPDCPLDGQGEVAELGTFEGPRGLGEILAGSDVLDACVVRQFHRFALGRREAASDEPQIERALQRFRESGHDFRQMITELIESEAFGFRIQE